MAEAHAQGLIHRDLKPSNIMLCERGGLYDFVKVLDFGLVKQQRAEQDLSLTDITSLTGTPLYLPPEAVQSPEKLDIRAEKVVGIDLGTTNSAVRTRPIASPFPRRFRRFFARLCRRLGGSF